DQVQRVPVVHAQRDHPAQLQRGLPLPLLPRRDHHPLARRDRPQPADDELPRQQHDHHPGRDPPQPHHHHERRHHDQLVRQWVHELPHDRDLVPPPRQHPVHHVRHRRQREQRRRQQRRQRVRVVRQPHEHRDDQDPPQRQHVGQVPELLPQHARTPQRLPPRLLLALLLPPQRLVARRHRA